MWGKESDVDCLIPVFLTFIDTKCGTKAILLCSKKGDVKERYKVGKMTIYLLSQTNFSFIVYVRPTVRQSRNAGNVIFSALIKDRRLKFLGIKYVNILHIFAKFHEDSSVNWGARSILTF